MLTQNRAGPHHPPDTTAQPCNGRTGIDAGRQLIVRVLSVRSRRAMRFMLLIYTDENLLNALPSGEFDRLMRDCLQHADELRAAGKLIDSQQLEIAASARSLRQRGERIAVVDGPFAETKELLAGFNLIEAADMDEALRIAAEFPWTRTGSIEVRPVRDLDSVRRRVSA